MIERPSFDDLTYEQQLGFGNGLGPWWLPDWARAMITEWASWFFKTASWRHHDFGYAVGGDRFDRLRCDRKFLWAMLLDALRQPILVWLLAAPVAIGLAVGFYAAVRVGGGRSFRFSGRRYATAQEVLLDP